MLLPHLPAMVAMAVAVTALSKLGEDLERCEAWLPVFDLKGVYFSRLDYHLLQSASISHIRTNYLKSLAMATLQMLKFWC